MKKRVGRGDEYEKGERGERIKTLDVKSRPRILFIVECGLSVFPIIQVQAFNLVTFRTPGYKLHSAPNHMRKSKFPTRAPRQRQSILSGLACESCWFGRPYTFLRSIDIAAQASIA